ncbi:hypothetical protein MCHI_003314, partial [Candidatus Magnetoovum chiemensis]
DEIETIKKETEYYANQVNSLNNELEKKGTENYTLQQKILTLETTIKEMLNSKTWKLGQLYGAVFSRQGVANKVIKKLFGEK